MSRFESVQSPSVIGFLIVLEIVIGPTNSSQSDTLQTSHQSDTLSKMTASCKIHLDTYPEHRRIFGSRLVADW